MSLVELCIYRANSSVPTGSVVVGNHNRAETAICGHNSIPNITRPGAR